jgi:hypothetical protein
MPPTEKTKNIGGMNMSSENFWELFTETGDIGYYLLYLESNEKDAGIKKDEQMQACGNLT